jgi:FixJ family two-component response regulator
MIAPEGIVFVIDDDASVRKSLKRLLTSAGHQTEVFASADEFLARSPHEGPSCLLIDVQMPGLNGMDLQEALIQKRRDELLIFITGHGDIQMCARAMKAGAADFLPKPLRSAELLKCVERTLSRSTEQRQRAKERADARALLDQLTPRQFEVMQLLATGMLNKQVGSELGLTEKTVKVHRGCIMKKIGITSVAEVVRLMAKAEVVAKPEVGTKV